MRREPVLVVNSASSLLLVAFSAMLPVADAADWAAAACYAVPVPPSGAHPSLAAMLNATCLWRST